MEEQNIQQYFNTPLKLESEHHEVPTCYVM